jgi:hypothetical protein
MKKDYEEGRRGRTENLIWLSEPKRQRVQCHELAICFCSFLTHVLRRSRGDDEREGERNVVDHKFTIFELSSDSSPTLSTSDGPPRCHCVFKWLWIEHSREASTLPSHHVRTTFLLLIF